MFQDLPAGMNKVSDQQMEKAEKQMKVWTSMIDSMTVQERETPELLAASPSRRRRIARGSGRKEVDVTNMIATFSGMRAQMQNMSKMMKMSGAAGKSTVMLACLLSAYLVVLSIQPW